MSEFDELLSEVLAADVRASPPDGMEHRIKAALHAATQRPWSERRYLREAIAAMLLIGSIAMAVRHRNVTGPKAKPGEERSIAKDAAPGTEFVTTPVVTVSPKRNHSSRSAPTVRSERPMRRMVASVASLEVETLVIQPIEVASLASDKITEQSPGWEERQ